MSEYVPPGRLFTDPVKVPVMPLAGDVKSTEPTVPVRLETSPTAPVGAGAPGPVTLIVRGTTVPWAMEIGLPRLELSVVLVVALVSAFHAFTRFAAFTDPSPVARSNPAVALNPVKPGTLLLPVVTSLKIQPVGAGVVGTVRALELQTAEGPVANRYSA